MLPTLRDASMAVNNWTYPLFPSQETVQFAGLVAGDRIEGGGGDDSEEIDESPLADLGEQPPKRRRKMQPGIKEDVFSLDEGAVVLQWPERLSKESAEDLKDWLELIGRKIKPASETPRESEDPEGQE